MSATTILQQYFLDNFNPSYLQVGGQDVYQIGNIPFDPPVKETWMRLQVEIFRNTMQGLQGETKWIKESGMVILEVFTPILRSASGTQTARHKDALFNEFKRLFEYKEVQGVELMSAEFDSRPYSENYEQHNIKIYFHHNREQL